jgi:hypothetical protein
MASILQLLVHHCNSPKAMLMDPGQDVGHNDSFMMIHGNNNDNPNNNDDSWQQRI